MQDNWSDFQQLWATAFPPLTERDGVKFWEKFVNSSAWYTLEQTFDMLADQHRTKRAAGIHCYTPRLADFRDLYWQITNRSMAAATPVPDCAACDNTGYVMVVMHDLEPGGWKICDKSAPFPASAMSLGAFAVPCFCRHAPRRSSEIDAMMVRDNNFGAPGGSRHKVQEFVDQCEAMLKVEQD